MTKRNANANFAWPIALQHTPVTSIEPRRACSRSAEWPSKLTRTSGKGGQGTTWERRIVAVGLLLLLFAVVFAERVIAQETDITQTPNTANAGIKKSLRKQIGEDRGDLYTPDSSLYIIGRDPFRAIVRGRQLFQRKFTVEQGFGPRTGDGEGDIETDGSIGAGLADSCAACHGRPQGAAGFGGDVFTRPTSRDAPHLFGLGLQEMLADEITQELRETRDRARTLAKTQGRPVTLPLQSKGIKYGTITAFPKGTVHTSNVQGVDKDLRVRPFFAEGTTMSIREFIVGALNAEMGLESADPDLQNASNGDDVVTPSGMVLSGSIDDIEAPPAAGKTADPDNDGVENEIPTSLVDFLEFYLLNYFRPGVRDSLSRFNSGRRDFKRIGCAACHVQNLLIEEDRRVADTATTLDYKRGNPFNNLFTEAAGRFEEEDDGEGPTVKTPLGGEFLVENIFTDFKRHNLGPNFWEKNFDGTIQKEFMTEALWGVGSTAPYGHDGRSPTLRDVILRHGGHAEAARDRFARLRTRQKDGIEAFLRMLVLFSPPATASNLNPVNRNAVDYPVNGHGSIDLGVLFNDPNDKE